MRGVLARHVRRGCGSQGHRVVQSDAVVETGVAAVAAGHPLGLAVVGTVPDAADHPRHALVGLHVAHRHL